MKFINILIETWQFIVLPTRESSCVKSKGVRGGAHGDAILFLLYRWYRQLWIHSQSSRLSPIDVRIICTFSHVIGLSFRDEISGERGSTTDTTTIITTTWRCFNYNCLMVIVPHKKNAYSAHWFIPFVSIIMRIFILLVLPVVLLMLAIVILSTNIHSSSPSSLYTAQ